MDETHPSPRVAVQIYYCYKSISKEPIFTNAQDWSDPNVLALSMRKSCLLGENANLFKKTVYDIIEELGYNEDDITAFLAFSWLKRHILFALPPAFHDGESTYEIEIKRVNANVDLDPIMSHIDSDVSEVFQRLLEYSQR